MGSVPKIASTHPNEIVAGDGRGWTGMQGIKAIKSRPDPAEGIPPGRIFIASAEINLEFVNPNF
jgi:hypothetical protein